MQCVSSNMCREFLTLQSVSQSICVAPSFLHSGVFFLTRKITQALVLKGWNPIFSEEFGRKKGDWGCLHSVVSLTWRALITCVAHFLYTVSPFFLGDIVCEFHFCSMFFLSYYEPVEMSNPLEKRAELLSLTAYLITSLVLTLLLHNFILANGISSVLIRQVKQEVLKTGGVL